MTYGLWLDMGLDEVCFQSLQSNPSLFNALGFKSAKDMTFDTLPLVKKRSELGDDNESTVYEFRLDALQLGKKSIGNPNPIVVNNVTVRVIYSMKSKFIVGGNILKYLAVNYNPTISGALYNLYLTVEGRQFLEQDRQKNINNFMQSMFYLVQSHNEHVSKKV